MSASEPLAIVQSKFVSGEIVVTATEASLIQGWIQSSRYIALIYKGTTHALAIFLTSKTPPQVYSDLTLEGILPIDQDFKCGIDTNGEAQDGLDIYMNITSRKLRLIFEMKLGEATSSLVSEIFRAIEVYQTAKSPAAEFSWIEKLTKSTRNLATGSKDAQDAVDSYRQVIVNSLHPGGIYTQVALVRLVGIMLLVYALETHIPFIENVCTDTVGTGIMGKLGNKGGVAVSCCIHNTAICFVNAHLAAHCEEFERRNQDYADICARLSFTKYVPPKNFKDHDQIYWLGDLNYRITDMDAATAKQCISEGNYGPVLAFDQLGHQRKAGRVFQGFQEAEIDFKPTYKYDPGTDNWDSSEKCRAPAWCDRILWKGDMIKSVSYKSYPELKISDHKPVTASFDSQIRIIDTAKYRKIHEEVMKKLDKLENEFLPQVMVDTTDIIFDILKFLEPSSKELIIANTGQVPVQFEFIKKLDDTNYCKDWLHIEPYTGFIKPGEKCDIKLEVYIDKKTACKLNSGEDKLYDILVLHLEGGKDIFITITGTYERSCFGSSMEALVHISVPIREIPIGRLVELENNKNLSQEPYPVPKEIWHLVDRLYRHGLKTPGLFETPGLHSEIVAIRDWLDEWSQDPMPGGVHSVAEALLLLLESTAEPLIPYNLHNVCLSAATNYLQCKQV
ncbi:PREDICTED: inositol polyphosphate 5-phosphatase OCRL-1-like, partial [Wasmannia auropunctata]|uniref:inositol polyphosphate 5-phosphatase OCRL-1-like n=1 Tax=Wasmannia auropunctata TaxID=64793 RepID=UPI0005F076B7